jgi:hypothetical protein
MKRRPPERVFDVCGEQVDLRQNEDENLDAYIERLNYLCSLSNILEESVKKLDEFGKATDQIAYLHNEIANWLDLTIDSVTKEVSFKTLASLAQSSEEVIDCMRLSKKKIKKMVSICNVNAYKQVDPSLIDGSKKDKNHFVKKFGLFLEKRNSCNEAQTNWYKKKGEIFLAGSFLRHILGSSQIKERFVDLKEISFLDEITGFFRRLVSGNGWFFGDEQEEVIRTANDWKEEFENRITIKDDFLKIKKQLSSFYRFAYDVFMYEVSKKEAKKRKPLRLFFTEEVGSSLFKIKCEYPQEEKTNKGFENKTYSMNLSKFSECLPRPKLSEETVKKIKKKRRKKKAKKKKEKKKKAKKKKRPVEEESTIIEEETKSNLVEKDDVVVFEAPASAPVKYEEELEEEEGGEVEPEKVEPVVEHIIEDNDRFVKIQCLDGVILRLYKANDKKVKTFDICGIKERVSRWLSNEEVISRACYEYRDWLSNIIFTKYDSRDRLVRVTNFAQKNDLLKIHHTAGLKTLIQDGLIFDLGIKTLWYKFDKMRNKKIDTDLSVPGEIILPDGSKQFGVFTASFYEDKPGKMVCYHFGFTDKVKKGLLYYKFNELYGEIYRPEGEKRTYCEA